MEKSPSFLTNGKINALLNDCCALLLWSQCCITTCPAEGVQSKKTLFLSLWPSPLGLLGMLFLWNILEIHLQYQWMPRGSLVYRHLANNFLLKSYLCCIYSFNRTLRFVEDLFVMFWRCSALGHTYLHVLCLEDFFGWGLFDMFIFTKNLYVF